MTATDRQQQIAQAEELLGDRLSKAGFAKGLFFGHYLSDRLPPYPDLASDSPAANLAQRVGQFCHDEIDAARIDREAEIPSSVIAGLGRLGVLGACLPVRCGGLGFGQTSYCRVLEVLGGHCASTALFVNAHHSIGPRALVLFGTPQQQDQWLPKLASGEWISAFALTESEAGSDAANVQSRAAPSDDGRGFVLNGEKRWITNGGIAHVLTVMARTPVEGTSETKVTAFLATPDMPGFEVVEKRMAKCGVRGTATSRLAFRNMFVPRENVLGKLGQGLRIALTVLDYGRTTFGATCTGAARFCLARAARHAATRVQFGQTIGSFELVKEKLAGMSAGTFAMEACTYQTAALIDGGAEEYMLETAMLKVFATETLRRIVNDTIQVFGGKAYFNDEPYERLLRDTRINLIGEGANDVLRAFVALVGMRDVGLELKGVLDAFMSPMGNFRKLGGFAGRRIGSWLVPLHIPVRSAELADDAEALGGPVRSFGRNVERLLRAHQETTLDRQYLLGRVADAAIEIYVSSCVIARLDQILRTPRRDVQERRRDLTTGRYFLKTAARRARQRLADLWDNDDEATTSTADLVL